MVTETVFENRFMHVEEFKRMSAPIKIEGRTAFIEGSTKFKGTKVTATDLRAGAALILCGLVADGFTEIHALHHIDRGYEDIVGKMIAVGADIERIMSEESAQKEAAAALEVKVSQASYA